MESGKIVSLYIDNEIIQISPFPFDKLTTLLDKAKEYYDGKTAFEKAKFDFERIKKEFDHFTEKPATDTDTPTATNKDILVTSNSPEPEVPEKAVISPHETVEPSKPSSILPERVIVPPSVVLSSEISHTSTTVQHRSVEEDAEYIVSHVKILSILKRSGKTASKDDIKSVISKHTTHDLDTVANKVIEILKAKGKIV